MVIGGAASLTDTLLINNVAGYGGGAAEGTGFSFYNCTMKHNSANEKGGALSGGGDFKDCVLIGNDATNGGAAYAESTTTFKRCVIAEGGASQQGAAVYSETAATEVRDSQVHGFATDASGGATTLIYIVAAVAVFDRVTWWSNNELEVVTSTDDASMALRNNEGLTATDAQTVGLLGCDDTGVGEYCAK